MPSFAEGFAQGKAQKQERADREELKKLQVKKFKADLDLQEKQAAAQEKFIGMMKDKPAMMPSPGVADSLGQIGIETPPLPATKGKSFADLATDSEFQSAGLQSGLVGPKDIGMATERKSMADFAKSLDGGSGGSLGFTPPSQKLFAITKDPKMLDPIKPVQAVVQGESGEQRIVTKNPYTGETIADLGQAKEEKLPIGDAGKLQSVQFADKMLKTAVDLLAPNGQMDQSLVLQMSLPVKFGKAREIDQLVTEAITTKVLIQSGVTARQEEIDEAKKRFIPNAFDLSNPGLAQRKLERLQSFMEGTFDLTVLPPSLVKRIKAKQEKEGVKDKPQDDAWTSDKQKRLEELRRKKAQGKI